MATAVSSYSNEELAVELALFADKTIGEGSDVVGKAKALFAEESVPAALNLILEQSKQLWIKATDKDLEGYYALFGSFLVQPGSPLSASFRDPLVNSVTSSVDRPLIRLAVLNNLYNSSADGKWRAALFEAILTFAIASKQNSILESMIADLDKLSQAWAVSTAEKQKLNYLIYELLADTEPGISHVHMLRWLESFTSETEAVAQADKITAAITTAMARTDVFQYQAIHNSIAAKVLAQKTPALFELLTILTNGNYKDFTQFAASNASLFTGDLTVEKTSSKMRILTLVSLASQNANILYTAAASALQVSDDEVEEWVLEAIGEGILDAKLDHLSSSIFVSYAIQREFGLEQWKGLKERVDKWKSNLQGMLEVLRNARAQGKDEQHKALHHGLVGSAQ